MEVVKKLAGCYGSIAFAVEIAHLFIEIPDAKSEGASSVSIHHVVVQNRNAVWLITDQRQSTMVIRANNTAFLGIPFTTIAPSNY